VKTITRRRATTPGPIEFTETEEAALGAAVRVGDDGEQLAGVLPDHGDDNPSAYRAIRRQNRKATAVSELLAWAFYVSLLVPNPPY